MPSFFPEGDTAQPFDNELRSLIKLVSIGGGGGSSATGNFSGNGDPNGVVTADAGANYLDLDSGLTWRKFTSGSNTGWA